LKLRGVAANWGAARKRDLLPSLAHVRGDEQLARVDVGISHVVAVACMRVSARAQYENEFRMRNQNCFNSDFLALHEF
jgi:hypothetical protein